MSTTHAPLAPERLAPRSDESEALDAAGRGQWPRRIIVATDGSGFANAAIIAARTLAQRSGASVEMTTVYSPHISLPPLPNRHGFKQCEPPDRSDAARLLAAVRRQRSGSLRPDERRDWHLRLDVGDPCTMILHAADEWAADLIMLSLGCRDPGDPLRNNRTALCLARNSNVALYAAGFGGEELTRCVVAFPAGRAHASTLKAAVRSLSPGGRMWIVLPERPSITDSDGIASGSVREIVTRACGPELKREVDAIEIDRVSVDGGMLSGVLRIADDVDAQLIAVPNHGSAGAIRAFLPNLGEPLLQSARCSVLIVPDSARTAPPSHTPKTQRAYERNLPGGGFAAIDVTAVKTMLLGWRYEGALVVERRGASRREGHPPPVILRAAGLSVDWVVRQLLPAARSNSAIGAGLLQLRAAAV